MNYENTISFLTLVATIICGLAFEYFGLKHRESSADARNDKAASQEAPPHARAAKTHSLEALSRRPVSNPPTGGRFVVAAPRAGVRPHSQRTAYTVHKYSYWRWSASSKGVASLFTFPVAAPAYASASMDMTRNQQPWSSRFTAPCAASMPAAGTCAAIGDDSER
jgi:hypothetical protein